MSSPGAPQQRIREVTHEELVKEYMAELQPLLALAESDAFDRLLQRFCDYPRFLARCARQDDPLKEVWKASNGTRVFDAPGAMLQSALQTAHFAACCHLLHGSQLVRHDLKPARLMEFARRFLDSCRHKPVEYINIIVGKFHAMDAIRTMQTLRVLGLVTKQAEEWYQLALGAGAGNREALSLHAQPTITKIPGRGGPCYMFRAERRMPAETILVDADPVCREAYEDLNNDASSHVRGIFGNAEEVLTVLPERQSSPRNLVTAIRFDHRMIPNPRRFLAKLSRCMAQECDLIFSIGAGDTLEDFRGRVETMQALFKLLESVGLEPVLFRLHGPGNLEQQWQSLRYGNPSASTYQLLYCCARPEILLQLTAG